MKTYILSKSYKHMVTYSTSRKKYMRIASPSNSSSNIFMFTKCSKRYIRATYIPDVNITIYNKSYRCYVEFPLRPPFYSSNRCYGIDNKFRSWFVNYIPYLEKTNSINNFYINIIISKTFFFQK